MNAKHFVTFGIAVASLSAAGAWADPQTSTPAYGYSSYYVESYRDEPVQYSPPARTYSYETYSSTPAPTYYESTPGYRSSPVYSYPAAASFHGTVESVEVIGQRRDGTGAGALIGGLAGGALGSQIGSGSGSTAATIGGALGGALLGNELERRHRTDATYQFSVRMDDGTLKTFTQDTPQISVGDRVRVADNGSIVLS